ncbi:putative Fungal pheromone mating factor STE2 GPCR-domain-containing protein [Seiridium cardinale]
MPPFNPKLQNFTILGPDGQTSINISMVVIDAQRVRTANLCISWGVQLGLCLMALLMVLLLIPLSRLRRAINIVHVSALVVAVVRLSLIIQYFPGPLAEFYVVWTKDRNALSLEYFNTNAAGNAFTVVQFALILTALIMQSWGLIKAWPDSWRYAVRASAIVLAIATIAVKTLWVVHYTWALRTNTLPIPLNATGLAATVMGAVSIFYFCGIFAFDLSLHLIATRGILTRMERGLTSLEILAVGNGILMILPTIFAGLDVASGFSGWRILPFDAGSWAMTLVVIGLPLIALSARYTGPGSAPSSHQPSHQFSLFGSAPVQTFKPHTSLAENTIDSRTAGSFMASAATTRANSVRSGRRGPYHGYRRHSFGGGTSDVELGIQVRQDISVILEGRGPTEPSHHSREL